MPDAGAMSVEVLDVLGRRVLVLHEGMMPAGSNTLGLDGSRLAPGTYIVRAVGEDFNAVQRITLVR
jgi:hypothetical protein